MKFNMIHIISLKDNKMWVHFVWIDVVEQRNPCSGIDLLVVGNAVLNG